MTFINLSKNNRGFTLIELIVAMVVISVALAGVLSVITLTTSYSANPVLRRQSIAIAESYLEEISLKSFNDPDGVGEVGRAQFDNVADYNGLIDVGARDQDGIAIAGLGGYLVAVNVQAVNFGPAGSLVAGLRINVAVTDPAGARLTLTGFRANVPPPP